ncbi:hypothetical protein J4861_02350 [Prevotella melaninogenica]|uniref:hypothetical protein n=1 Tax=Prevotella melaninogenica TaxID=28132 RepID=UPI001BAB7531|nr:hypothetical protein [Prevotella melaninogenica]QUB60911.1 hypothetical protein J4861_02350 [Prevotella melaninogenica]
MKKKLFKTRLLSFAAFCGLALAFVSCANEDVAQGTTGTEIDNDKNLTTFVAGDEAKTRTSMDYTSGNFYWEAGDYIYVKDDDGTWQKSSNAPTGKVASFKFKVPGKFKNHTTYKVYYPGKNGSNDQVTIPAAQSQSEPNSTAHFGVSGDCGTATATGTVGGGSFSFALDHQAAILVLQPYNPNATLNDCYLTKVEVTSDNNITGTYTLDPSSGELTGTGTGKQIVVTTAGSSVSPNGFPIKKVASVTDNSAYVLIKPGTHTLTVKYTLKDIATNVEGTITKTLSAFNYDKNTYYDMTANLDIKDYDGDHYYMWDAQEQYWKGFEWTHKNPLWQPTLSSYLSGATTSTFYPQSKATDPTRWYNDSYLGSGVRNDAQTSYFKTLPNANELSWYVVYGDPRWDADRLWTTMGHLYKGGAWFKKKSVLIAEGHYNTEKSADNITDLRIMPSSYSNTSWTPGLPTAADANKYFYLPALGYSILGQQSQVGSYGGYWSSSASAGSSNNQANSINFSNGYMTMGGAMGRHFGFRAQPFSDFGNN